MAMNLSPVLKQRFFDSNGDPLAGGKVYSYQNGTTTPQNTYTDSTGGTPNANPVILDANGEAAIWVDPSLSYKFVVKNSSDVTQFTTDNVVGLLSSNSVSTVAIQDDAVTQAKIGDDAVGASQLQDSASVDGDRAVTTNHIRDSAITPMKVSAEALIPLSLLNYSLTASVGSNALTIALKTKAGANASATDPVKIAFRNATAATGDYSVVSATAATSLVISSGSTLGHASAVNQYVYVYAINNAGTIELAASGQRIWDEGTVQSTTAEGGAGAADSSNVLYSTTARSNIAVRLIGRLKSNQATAGTWASSISEISLGSDDSKMQRHELIYTTGAGHGSTNTRIRRIETMEVSTGSAITYASTAGNGTSFTINEDGLYYIAYTDKRAAGGAYIGVSLNSAQLTTGVESITASTRKAFIDTVSTGFSTASCIAPFRAGDVLRPHTNATPDDSTSGCRFQIMKIAD